MSDPDDDLRCPRCGGRVCVITIVGPDVGYVGPCKCEIVPGEV